jgi:hypothetical protein
MDISTENLDVEVLFDDSISFEPSLSSCCCCCTAATSETMAEVEKN